LKENTDLRTEHCRQIEGALRELLECKALKESLPSLAGDLRAWGLANAEYQRRKPLAWERARKVLGCNPQVSGAGSREIEEENASNAEGKRN